MANVPTLGGQGGTPSLSPTLIQVGPGLLYTNVTKPADTATLLVSGQASGANDQRVWGPLLYTVSGTFAGSTIGQSNISYSTTFVDIDIEQALTPVEKVLTREDARIVASIAELSSERLQETSAPSNYFSPVATLKTIDADPLMSSQYRHTITVGGIRLVEPQCVALISANRRISVAAGPYSYVFCCYNAVSTEGFDIPFSRGGHSVWRVTFEALADTARTIGDQLFQLTVRNASSS